jgi:UrcA family protein
MRKSVIAVLAALAFMPTPAFAASALEEASVAVKYADLDLTSPAGAETLDARVGNAVDKVCAKPDIREIKAMRAFEACQAEARDAAMEQLSVANPFDGIELASNF